MSKSLLSRSICAVSLLACAGVANAALVLTTRWGQLSTNYSYGQMPDIRNGNDSWSSESLTSEFNGHIFGSSSGEGNGPNGPWQAGISYDLSQTFNPTGSGFEGSGQTSLSSFLVGSGFSSVSTGLPGNNLLVMFDNTSATDFVFSGSVTDHAFITLQRYNGTEWESVFSTSGAGAFTLSGTLTPGNYYIRGIGDGSTSGNMATSSSWTYGFGAVPEPASVVVLGVGALALLRRRRSQG